MLMYLAWIFCSVLIMLSPTTSKLAAATNISTWAVLNSSVLVSAAGKTAVVMLSKSFAMTGYPPGGFYNGIGVSAAGTAITISGNNAVFDASNNGRVFSVDGPSSVRLTVSCLLALQKWFWNKWRSAIRRW
jgi:hypothetical protein